MSNEYKLLKTIDWFIDVPYHEGTDDFFKNERIKSSIFDVEYNTVKTEWRLGVNFNRK